MEFNSRYIARLYDIVRLAAILAALFCFLAFFVDIAIGFIILFVPTLPLALWAWRLRKRAEAIKAQIMAEGLRGDLNELEVQALEEGFKEVSDEEIWKEIHKFEGKSDNK